MAIKLIPKQNKEKNSVSSNGKIRLIRKDTPVNTPAPKSFSTVNPASAPTEKPTTVNDVLGVDKSKPTVQNDMRGGFGTSGRKSGFGGGADENGTYTLNEAGEKAHLSVADFKRVDNAQARMLAAETVWKKAWDSFKANEGGKDAAKYGDAVIAAKKNYDEAKEEYEAVYETVKGSKPETGKSAEPEKKWWDKILDQDEHINFWARVLDGDWLTKGNQIYDTEYQKNKAATDAQAQADYESWLKTEMDTDSRIVGAKETLERTAANLSDLHQELSALTAQMEADPSEELSAEYAAKNTAFQQGLALFNKLEEDYSLTWDNVLNEKVEKGRESDASGWAVAGNTAATGLAGIAQAGYATLDFLAPTEFLGKYDYISKWNNQKKADMDYWNARRAASLEGKGKAAEFLSDLGVTAIEMIPNAVAAMSTYGGSALATGAPVLSAGQAGAGWIGSTVNSARTVVGNMLRNPAYYTSAAMTLGRDYEEAKASGASDLQAAAYAIITTALNAGVEVGGGIETLPKALREADGNAVLKWVLSAPEEGLEEIVQRGVSGTTQKTIYNPDKAVFSMTNEDAIIHLPSMAKEFALGTAAGGFVGGVETGVHSVADAANNKKHAKIGADYHIVKKELIEEGLSFGNGYTAYTVAEELQTKAESGEEITSADLGRLVAAIEQSKQTEEGNAPNADFATISEKLMSAGATEADAGQLAPILNAILTGEEISGNQAGTIAKNEAAVSILEKVTGEEIDTDAPLGQVKTAIRSLASRQSTRTETGEADKTKNAASGTETTNINTNPAEHTAAEQNRVADFVKATNEEVKNFFLRVQQNGGKVFERKNLIKVSSRQAADAAKILGGNYEGYTNAINSNSIKHILDEHGPDGTVDHSFADLNDAARLEYVLENYDNVEPAKYSSGDMDTSAEFRNKDNTNKDNTPAPMLKYQKRVNGNYYVIEAIPDSKHKKFWVVSAYMEKANDVTQAPDAQSPRNTPMASLASPTSASGSSIPDSAGNSNGNFEESRKQMVTDLAKTLGKAGSTVMTEMYDGSQNAEQYAENMLKAYHAGEIGAEMPTGLSSVTPLQLRAAYDAGRTDAAGTAGQEDTLRALTAKYWGEEAGLVRDKNFRKSSIDSKQARVLDAVGKALGVKIVVDSTIDFKGKKAAGLYIDTDGTIHLAADAADPVMTVFTHEIVHRLREAAPEAYMELATFVMENADSSTLLGLKLVESKKADSLDADSIDEEVVANAFGRLMGDRNLLEQFAAQCPESAHKIRDAIRDIVVKIREFLHGAADMSQHNAELTAYKELGLNLDTMAQKLSQALERAQADAKRNSEKTAGMTRTVAKDGTVTLTDKNGKVVAQTKTTAGVGSGKAMVDQNYADEVEQWFRSTTAEERRRASGKYFVAGTTSEVLKSLGVRDERIRFYGAKMQTILDEHSEMSRKLLKMIPTILEDPVIVMKSVTRSDSIAVVNEQKAKNGEYVFVVLRLHPKKGIVVDNFLKISSAYSRSNENIRGLLFGTEEYGPAEVLYLAENKDRAEAYLNCLRVQFPSHQIPLGSIGTISYAEKTVNIQGKTYSELLLGKPSLQLTEAEAAEQAEFLKEWKQKTKEMTPAEIANLTMEDANAVYAGLKMRKTEKRGDRESSFYGSVQDSDNVLFQTRELAETAEDIRYYQGISNEETLEKANEALNIRGRNESERFLSLKKDEATAQDVALGFILLKRYQDAGEYEGAVRIIQKLREIGTAAGQTVQTFSLLGRMTPEGMSYYAQTELDKARERMVKKKGEEWAEKRKEMFLLTEEETRFIRENIEKASRLPEGRDKNILLSQIAEMIQNKMPTNVGRMLKGLAREAMLLNPKTLVRNVAGNVLMMPAYVVQDFIGSGVDQALAKQSGVRTTGTTLPNKAALAAARKGIYESYDDWRRHVNTKNVSGDRFEIGQGPAFTHYGKEQRRNANLLKRSGMWVSNAFHGLDRLMGFLLEVGDRPFFEYHFINALNNQLRLNGAEEATEEMVQIATTEALSRTWQDDNKVTKAAQGLIRIFNAGGEYGFGSVLVPFVKTPANLTKALIEYSPAALVTVVVRRAQIYNRSRKSQHFDPKTQKAFVDSLSKAITGTLVMAIGGFLATTGIISGGDDDKDKDLKDFEKNIMGIAPYSVVVDGKSYTYDWAQPVGSLIAITADVVQAVESGDGMGLTEDVLPAAGNIILEALKTGGNVLYEQSFLQGISDLFSEDDLMSGLIDAVFGWPTQFVATALSQIAQMADPYARTTYEYKKTLQTTKNKVKAKIPGLRNRLANVVDVLGHDVLSYGGENNVWNVFFNPTNIYAEAATAAAKEIYRVYGETGETAVIPRKAPYYVEHDGKKYKFSSFERADVQRVMGQTTEKAVNDLLKNTGYASLSDEEKAKVLEKIVGYSAQVGKKTYLKGQKVSYKINDSWMEDALEAEKKYGVPVGVFVLLHCQIAGVVSLKDKDGKAIDNSSGLQKMQIVYNTPGLTESQRNALFEYLGVGEKIRHWNKARVNDELEKMRKKAG